MEDKKDFFLDLDNYDSQDQKQAGQVQSQRKPVNKQGEQSQQQRKPIDPQGGQSQQNRRPIDPQGGQSQQNRRPIDPQGEQSQQQRKSIDPQGGQSQQNRRPIDPQGGQSQQNRRPIDPQGGQSQQNRRPIDPQGGQSQQQGRTAQSQRNQPQGSTKPEKFKVYFDEDDLNEFSTTHNSSNSDNHFSEHIYSKSDSSNPKDEKFEAKSERKQLREERKRKKRKKKKSGCVFNLIYISIIIVISVVISQFAVAGFNDVFAVNREQIFVEIDIPKNADTETVTDILYEAGAIQRKEVFELYATVTKSEGTYKFGKYSIDTSMDYEAIISHIQSNRNRIDIVKVTFPEGMTVQEMGARLENNNVCSKADFLKAVNNYESSNEYVNRITNVSQRYYKLEGYLFPDTYNFYIDELPENVISIMLDNFKNKITKEYADRAEELDMTIDEVITLAAIIQFEAANATDMYNVSSVFHNRLNNPETYPRLESDPTVWYPYKTKKAVMKAHPEAWQGQGYTEDDDIPPELLEEYNSRYNTYRVEGLPYGPITNPGMDAIKAALYPKDTGYYFFVVDANGKPYYAKNITDHNKNVAYAESVPKNETTPDDEYGEDYEDGYDEYNDAYEEYN